MAKEDFVRAYDSSEAASRVADGGVGRAIETAKRDLRDALVELKDEANWALHHLKLGDDLARTVESGEVAVKIRGVVEAGEALRAALDRINAPAIAEPWPQPRRS